MKHKCSHILFYVRAWLLIIQVSQAAIPGRGWFCVSSQFCYYPGAESVSYSDAVIRCKVWGANLAQIETETEARNIAIFYPLYAKPACCTYWIGLERAANNEWQWRVNLGQQKLHFSVFETGEDVIAKNRVARVNVQTNKWVTDVDDASVLHPYLCEMPNEDEISTTHSKVTTASVSTTSAEVTSTSMTLPETSTTTSMTLPETSTTTSMTLPETSTTTSMTLPETSTTTSMTLPETSTTTSMTLPETSTTTSMTLPETSTTTFALTSSVIPVYTDFVSLDTTSDSKTTLSVTTRLATSTDLKVEDLLPNIIIKKETALYSTRSKFTEADKRSSAIAVGCLSLAVITVIVGMIICLDIHALKISVRYLASNCKSVPCNRVLARKCPCRKKGEVTHNAELSDIKDVTGIN